MTHPFAGWRITPHALDRARAMSLDPNQIVDTVLYPSMTYPGAKGHPRGRVVHVRGDLCVVVDPARRTIVTFLGHRAVGRAADGTAIYRDDVP